MYNLGIGVVLKMLSGNQQSFNAYTNAINKIIKDVRLDEESNTLLFRFDDETTLTVKDNGQSCCEVRYMRTDDNLSEFSGARLLGMAIKDVDNAPDEYGEHEIQFFEVTTDRGVFSISNHNEHNGYYGGFAIELS